MNSLLSAILFLFLACGQLQIAAQYPQIFFTQYNTQDGLSGNLCGQVIRDQKGYAWIATTNGLNRFDGYHFQVFRNIPGDSTSLSSNEIYYVHEDVAGNIWVSNDEIVSMLDKATNSFRHFENAPADDKSYSGGDAILFNDREGNLWLSSYGGGLNLFHLEDNSFSHFYPDNANRASGKNLLGKLDEDDNGDLWIASREGLCSFSKSDSQFQFFAYKPEDKANYSFNNLSLSVYCDGSVDELVWYGTWGSGLHCYNKTTGEIRAYRYNLEGPINLTNIVFDIHERDENTLWVGTERGLGIFDKRTHTFFFYAYEVENPHSLSGTDARSVVVDKENTLWVSTSTGLSIASAGMQNFSLSELPGDASSSQIIFDERGKKIYGVNYYNNRSLNVNDLVTGIQKSFPIPKADEMQSEPFGLFLDSRGMIWIGCMKTGVYLFNPTTSTFTKLETEKALQIDDGEIGIRAFAEDREGNIWMASYGHGIIKFDVGTKQFHRFSNDIAASHIPFNGCFKIIEDENENVWGFFEGTGICVIDKKTEAIKSYDFKREKRYQPMASMADATIDVHNRVWISTKSNGLVLLDGKQQDEGQVTVFNSTNQFPHNNLGSLVLDNKQNLWIAGSDGVIFFDTEAFTSKVYTEQNGLYPYQSFVTLSNARNGEIWFSVQGGYCAFTPEKFKMDSTTFPVVLNSFKVFDKELYSTQSLDDLDRIELRHEQNFISVEFAALCFSNPLGVQYAYMLAGLETDWNYCGDRRYVSYTDLKPGEYTLKIKAANGDGIWNENPKTILITIHPAWWQTTVFKIALFVLVVMVTLLAIRIFTRRKVRQLELALARQKEVQDIRNRMARDIHDEIGSGLTKISVMSSKLNTQTELDNEAQQLTDRIQTASRDVIESLGEIVWTVNPKNDSLGNLLSYIRQYAGKYFDSTSIAHKVEIAGMNEEQKRIELSPEVRRNLLMIVKEALNNVVKHSGASRCEISIRVDERSIRLTVNDNGKGIKASPQPLPNEREMEGNGLKNMQKRADEVAGRFEIISNQNIGTSVSVSIPLG